MNFAYTSEYQDEDSEGCVVSVGEKIAWLSFSDNEDGTATLSGIPMETD